MKMKLTFRMCVVSIYQKLIHHRTGDPAIENVLESATKRKLLLIAHQKKAPNVSPRIISLDLKKCGVWGDDEMLYPWRPVQMDLPL